MEIKGKVYEMSEVLEISSTFKKRELILEYSENPAYPEYLKFEVIQEKVALLEGIKLGAFVEVSFNLKGRSYTDKNGKTAYFNTMQVWRLKVIEDSSAINEGTKSENMANPVGSMPSSNSSLSGGASSANAFDIQNGSELDNDLPF